MRSYKVLISAPYLVKEIERFRDELKGKNIEIDIYPVKERLEESELLPIIERYHGVICGDDRFTPKVFDAAKKLSVVVKWGTGIDSINKEYAESKGIKICNTPNAFTEPVSDSIIGIMLAFTRRIFTSDRIMKAGKWEKAFGVSMGEVSLGIIGLGNIGKAVARKLQPFQTKVYGNDILEIEEAKNLNVEVVELPELLKNSDVVAICCDLNPSSHHLINKETLSLMKSSAILINTARGPIVKESDLIEALLKNEIAGAGLDVFEEEPLEIDSPLRKLDNVILSSHNVNASPYHWNRIHRNSLDMLYQHLKK